MAKLRFTDCGKWRDPWFMDLPPVLKLLWQYLCDNCDNAGVWPLNTRLAEFEIGASIDWKAAETAMAQRIEFLDGGRKWWLRKYLDFQYPSGLSEECLPHRQILRLLAQHGLDYVPSDSVIDRKARSLSAKQAARVGRRVRSTHKATATAEAKASSKGSPEGKPPRADTEDLTGGVRAVEPPDPVRALSPWVRWRTNDPARTEENREEILALVGKYGLPFVQLAAEKFAHANAEKAWPDELLPALAGGREPRGAAEEITPEAAAERDFVARHGWQAIRTAIGLEKAIRSSEELHCALRENPDLLEAARRALEPAESTP